jgi:hypothetical protein
MSGLSQIDPELPFMIGPMNVREARKSGLRLKAQVARGTDLRKSVVGRFMSSVVSPVSREVLPTGKRSTPHLQ